MQLVDAFTVSDPSGGASTQTQCVDAGGVRVLHR